MYVLQLNDIIIMISVPDLVKTTSFVHFIKRNEYMFCYNIYSVKWENRGKTVNPH
jgi:hypothetical protein